MGADHVASAAHPKRKKIEFSAQLMDILEFEQPIVSGKLYNPERETEFPLDVESKGWEFLLQNVQLSKLDFERNLDRMIKTTEAIGEMDPEKRLDLQNSIMESFNKASSRLQPDMKQPKNISEDGGDKVDMKEYVEMNDDEDVDRGTTNGLRHRVNGHGKFVATTPSKAKGRRDSQNGEAIDAEIDKEIVYEFGGPIGTFSIMIFSHVIMYYLWLSVEHKGGQLFIPSLSDLSLIYHDCFPTQRITFIYLAFIAYQAVLGAYLPGFIAKGLPVPSENYKILEYNCNGIGAWWVTLLTVFVLEKLNLFHLHELAENYGKLMTVMVIFGDLMSVAIYSAGFIVKKTHRMSGNHIYDFFMGSWLNPRIGSFDLKLWAEVRVSWFTLYLLTLSCFMKDYHDTKSLMEVHPGLYVMLIAHWLYTNACVKGEECIVTTWDIFYEKWGWMLIFWNFAGVPIVYTWNSFYIQKIRPELPWRCGIYITVMVLITYYIWDITNSQKNRFRMQLRGTFKERPWYVFPQLPWGTLHYPVSIRTAHGNRLLISGTYGLFKTRKIHYLMDILFALEWGMAAGAQAFLPYFYLCFFSAFILHRGIRDNERCEKKYGKDWDRYCKLVPYILIPGIW